jgi:putative tryptophan/tyrosine transport system substrate-binding protein
MQRREFVTLLGGAAAAWPLVARAQQPAMPMVGLLSASSPEGYAQNVAAVRRGLSETGFVEGRNLLLEFLWAEDHYDRLTALADDLVRRRVAVIVAGGLTAALAAKAATATIPIVFSAASDPVRAGLVASLNRPGGNATGMAGFSDSLVTKRLEILRELLPKATVVGMLVNPSAASAEVQSGMVLGAARTLGVQIRILNVENQEQLDGVLASAARERIDAIVVPASTVFTNGLARLVALAARHAIPAIYETRNFVVAGGLISYGNSRNAGADAAYQQVGVYVGRILKGEKPADLPVVQPTRFELVINHKTAKALGLDVPAKLLALTDEVIE